MTRKLPGYYYFIEMKNGMSHYCKYPSLKLPSAKQIGLIHTVIVFGMNTRPRSLRLTNHQAIDGHKFNDRTDNLYVIRGAINPRRHLGILNFILNQDKSVKSAFFRKVRLNIKKLKRNIIWC